MRTKPDQTEKTPEQLRARALRLLSGRSHSCAGLRKKLLDYGGSAEDVEELIARYVETQLLDDARYAESLVHQYSRRGKGAYAIRQELLRHGVPPALWDAALEVLPPAQEGVDAYLEARLRSSEPREVKRASDALARRGFSWSEIRAGLQRRQIALQELEDESF